MGIEEMECEQHGRCGCESEKEGYGLGGASATKMRANKVQVQVGNERQSRVAHLKSVKLQSKTRDQNLTARERKEKRTCIRVTTNHQNKTRCQRAVQARGKERNEESKEQEKKYREERRERTKEGREGMKEGKKRERKTHQKSY